MNETIRAHVTIQGRVQGVFFRVETRRAARGYGVSGWVQNLPDGSVEAVMEGTRRQVEQLVDWCRKGPPHARVDKMDVRWKSATGEFHSFNIT